MLTLFDRQTGFSWKRGAGYEDHRFDRGPNCPLSTACGLHGLAVTDVETQLASGEAFRTPTTCTFSFARLLDPLFPNPAAADANLPSIIISKVMRIVAIRTRIRYRHLPMLQYYWD